MAFGDLINNPNVDKTSSNFASSYSLVFASTPSLGNLLVCGFHCDGAPANVPAGWSRVKADDTSNNDELNVFFKISDGTETSIALQPTGGGGSSASYYEFEGPFDASPLDVSETLNNSGGSSANTLSFTGITPTEANSVVLCFGGHRSGSASFTGIDAGFTSDVLNVGSNTTGASFAHKVLSTASAQAPTLSIDASVVGIGILVAFKGQGAPDTTPPTNTTGPTAINATQNGHDINVTLDEDGTVYAVRLPDGAAAPTAAQVKAGQDSTGAAALEARSISATGGQNAVLTFSTAAAATPFDYYVVAEDDEAPPNVQATPVLVEGTTLTPSLQVTGVSAGPYYEGTQVTVTFSDALGSLTGSQPAGAITEDSQNASTYVFTIGDPKTFGDRTTPYNTDITFTLSDGTNQDTFVLQITPSLDDDYGSMPTKAGAWLLSVFDVVPLGYPLYIIGDGAVDIDSGSFEAGYTYLIYVQDTGGDNAWSNPPLTFNVPNAGSEPPVITLLGQTVLTIALDSTYNEAGATATDGQDGNVTGDIVITGTVDATTLGTYYLNYDVTDSDGNAATTVQRTVHVTDQTVPVITLLGDAVVEIDEGDTYNDAGATASDNVDGNITGNIAVGGDTVDPNTIGTYVITYNVTDAAGNVAAQVTRTVNVLEVIVLPPVQPPQEDTKTVLALGFNFL